MSVNPHRVTCPQTSAKAKLSFLLRDYRTEKTFGQQRVAMTLARTPKLHAIFSVCSINSGASVEVISNYLQVLLGLMWIYKSLLNPLVITYSSLKTFEATCYGKVKHLSKDDYYSKGNSKKIEVGPMRFQPLCLLLFGPRVQGRFLIAFQQNRKIIPVISPCQQLTVKEQT